MKNITAIPQPSEKDWKFIKELSEPINCGVDWKRTLAEENEADLNEGVQVQNNFPDDNLETAYNDLGKFFTNAGISLNGNYKIITEKIATESFESYRLDIMEHSCRIQAEDPEGIRRGIYYLEDLLLGADGAFLPIGVIKRVPWLKSRISRCFFGPINRPPLNRDELLDDVDYYPNEYLNRLAHESVNGLWLTIAFSDLCKTSITELDPNAKKRLTKLRQTVQQCLRYGIKTYIFCIEPRSMPADHPVFLHNPELKGAKSWDGKYCFCPFSDIAQKYLYEATNWIFSQVPNLGGMINISYGERSTTCMSCDFGAECPICSKKTPGEIIFAALKPMECGMHTAAPDTELISWLYVPQNGTGDIRDKTLQMLDIAKKSPENVILQYNFESGGTKKQLGKLRQAGDYWLSYIGPSDIFQQISQRLLSANKMISAKIQVGCSHELATVPFVPVPGLLYKKYKHIHQLEVSHVMQCWYFGNYPGIMNKTAGELSFESFQDTEHNFLLRIAIPQWGEHARKVVEAWKLLAEGYSHYPLENMFQYYGPMHDSVVWPLYLIPENKPLAPTWRLDYGCSGDRYGECLGEFSLDEVLALCQIICETWKKGVAIMQDLRSTFCNNPERLKDIDLVEALGILFESGYNILKFYSLREILLTASSSECSDSLLQMENIVIKEIKYSSRMIELCEADSRLGFHSEAEGYKFFPDKLKWRIEQLQNLLTKDFTMVKNRIINQQQAFINKNVKIYACNSGKLEKSGDFFWRADYDGEKIKITVHDSYCSNQNVFRIFIEPKPFYPPMIITFQADKGVEIPLCVEGNTVAFNIVKASGDIDSEEYSAWESFSPLPPRLGLGDYNPQSMGKLILT